MESKSIEVSELDSIILTNKGKVVGYVKVKHQSDYIHFMGSAVNVQDFKNHHFTHNLFGCSSAITTDQPAELDTPAEFIEALQAVAK